MSDKYIFTFSDAIAPQEILSVFQLALLATESLYGATALRMDCGFTLRLDKRYIFINIGNETCMTLARIFAGFVFKWFERGQFHVNRAVSGNYSHGDREVTHA